MRNQSYHTWADTAAITGTLLVAAFIVTFAVALCLPFALVNAVWRKATGGLGNA